MTSNPQPYVARILGLVGDDDPRAILAATPSRVSSLIASADPRLLASKPGPSAWSVNQIVAHLADAELVGGYRLRMIATANGTPIQAFDQDRWAAAFEYDSCDAAESARIFAACRTGTLRMLDRLAPGLMDNHGMHEERGKETIRHLLRLYAGHDRNHLEQIERILGASGATRHAASAQKPEIPLDLVERIDLRVGTIVGIADVPDADRLMRLTVDFGSGTRQVIAGIRQERRDPQTLVGRQALFFYNLPPRTIRGQESQAMLCDVGYADGLTPALMEPEWPVPNGARAG